MASVQSLAIAHTRARIDRCTLIHVVQLCVAALSQQIITRMILSYILETCLQLNLQSTLFVLSLAATRLRTEEPQMSLSHVQIQALVSLAFGVAMMLLKILEVRDFLGVAATVDH